jgi:hypothetical protein
MSYCVVKGATRSGIRIVNSFPFLSHCEITNNSSSSSGGGLYVSLTGPPPGELLTISGCTISDNSATSGTHGGGVFVVATDDTACFEDCIIASNTSLRSDGHVTGGGARVSGHVQFNRCTIKDNLVRGSEGIPGGSSSGRGGGIWIDDGSVELSNCLIQGNTAHGTAPGGMQGNQGFASGGGVHVQTGDVTFFNTVLWGNTASSTHGTNGGGLYAASGQVSVTNCTLMNNTPLAIDLNTAAVTVMNSILYFNNGNAAHSPGTREHGDLVQRCAGRYHSDQHRFQSSRRRDEVHDDRGRILVH